LGLPQFAITTVGKGIMGWRKFVKSAIAPELPAHYVEHGEAARKMSFTSSNGSKGIADFDVLTTSAFELSVMLNSNAITSVEIVEQYLAQIDQHNRRGRQIRALISVAPRHGLLEVARQLDEERVRGEIRGPLHGVPIVLKDNIMTDASLGMDTTVGWLSHPDNTFSLADPS
jgi:amidase